MRRILVSVTLLLLTAAPSGAVLPSHDDPTRTLWLIRHGEYDHGVDAPDEGDLVALGRQQARLLAARLSGYPVSFTSLQTSTMARARETAEILAARFPDLTLQTFDDIRECTPTIPWTRPRERPCAAWDTCADRKNRGVKAWVGKSNASSWSGATIGARAHAASSVARAT
ncbi:hypothetical protein COW53_03865 [bacterium CG17_big_fil_post_rev_8_21_14_2_50_64_8]|nr:MAG: hypothetical protein COW53_03865 [bacterium CG17_big_fil_post_rev_8_21_14_2_50_64_8]PJA73437.1 MAG: hypothetical protein CO151_13835 [bacterium CG_4_9_14_3_um_filter_65_15]